MLLFLFHEVWATSPNPPPSRLHCVHEKFILKVQSSVQKTTIMKNEDVEKKQMEKTLPKKTVRQLLLTQPILDNFQKRKGGKERKENNQSCSSTPSYI